MVCPLLSFADVTGTITLTSGQRFSFDSGTVVSSGGDLLWNGSTLAPQGSAGAAIFSFFGTTATYNIVTAQLIAADASQPSSNPLPANALIQTPIFVVKTNGGNYGKALVTSDSGGSITFQYDTFTSGGSGSGGSGGSGGTGTGSLTAVENAATNLVPGLPNSPIAQGALFV